MESILTILLGGVLVNNYVLQNALGVAPFLGYSHKNQKTAAMGIATTLVMLLATLITWPLQTYLLAPLNAAYLQTLVFVVVIAAVVYLADAVARNAMHSPLKLYAPMIVLNGAVLGVTMNNITLGYTYGQAMLATLGVGLGFLLALLLMNGIQSKISDKHVPKAFRGLPSTLVAASILALAVMAFK